MREAGQTALLVATDVAGLMGVIGVADQMRPEAPETMRSLKQMGIRQTVILTGDHERVARNIAAKLGADEKDKLEKALGIGQERNYYGPALQKLGWKITSVNDNDPNHLEYEIVKGDQSYEVMIDFDSSTRKATEVDVETNIWEAERTEKVKGDE